jgi:hypothetical protein
MMRLHDNRRGRQSEKREERREMKLFKALGIGICFIVLCSLVAPKVKADAWDRKTVVTFTEPVEVPGVGAQVLPPGTYVFKVLNAASDRHTIQIFNQDETQVLTTILAIPNYRIKPSDKTVITFEERPEGEPQALKAWFYPGREVGEQFVYARPRAVELAKETNEDVLSTPVATDTASMETAPVEAVNPSGDTVASSQVVEGPPPTEMAQATPPPSPAQEPAPAAPLPKTASDLPLIGLIGLLTLGGGIGLSFLVKLSA